MVFEVYEQRMLYLPWNDSCWHLGIYAYRCGRTIDILLKLLLEKQQIQPKRWFYFYDAKIFIFDFFAEMTNFRHCNVCLYYFGKHRRKQGKQLPV